MRPSSPLPLLPPLALSGASALVCELVWTRRLSLAFGSTGVAVALTLGLYMAGLGLGGAWAGRRRWAGAPRGYAALELGAASWTLAFPWLAAAVLATNPVSGLAGSMVAAAALLLLPAFLHGATLAAAAAALHRTEQVAVLYAANTAGAVLGCLAAPLLLLPLLGVRGTELVAAMGSAGAAAMAWKLAPRGEEGDVDLQPVTPVVHGVSNLDLGGPVAAATAGAVAMALEVAWTRLGALLLGGSVYALALVLAVFLASVALGAELGRRWGRRAATPGLAALAVGALLGTLFYGWLPHGLALAWSLGGEPGVQLGAALLLALAMGAAPLASGVVFAAALDGPERDPSRAASRILAANTAGGVVGALGAGLLGLPALGVQGVVTAAALLCGVVALALAREQTRLRIGLATAMLALGLGAPRWDAPLYAVGLYTWLDRFADLSPRAVDQFAHQGWTLRSYEDGRTATVGVGEGTASGVRWMSVNGKIDASTGQDMPTQVLSGQLPVFIAAALAPGRAIDALVVGLASGVTAGEALAAGASSITVVEIEPAVIRAAEDFSAVNRGVLHDPRATLVTGDARAWLGDRRSVSRRYTVIVSEPSNPWITGVSNLFTQEYWRLAQSRLAADGVFCQWVQLYALPPDAFRGLVRTFLSVFPQTWLFETIPGADALLIAAPSLPEDLPLAPTLGPAALARLAGRAPMNTDDRPWVEFEAPKWLYRSTGAANQALIEAAGENSPERPLHLRDP